MLRKIIRGELRASNPEIKPTTVDFNWNWNKVYHALGYNKHLRELINHDREWYGADSVWSLKGSKLVESGVAFNSPSPAWEDRQEFLNFINALKELMETEEAVTLGLEGSFEITMETVKYPLVIRVKIEDGKVSYQEAAHIIWGENVTV